MPANTKTMIAETFFNLAKGKSIDKITVTDLVERCKISRQTFYYHFKDIMDVLEWGMGETAERTLKRSLEASSDREAMGIFVSMWKTGDFSAVCSTLSIGSRSSGSSWKVFGPTCKSPTS